MPADGSAPTARPRILAARVTPAPYLKDQLMPTQHRMAKCHPERQHAAKGMCFPCYRDQYPNAKRATCEHTHRIVKANGVCGACYDRQLRDRDPEYADRQKENYERWAASHGDRVREYRVEYNGRPYVKRQRTINGRVQALARYGLTWEDELRIISSQGGKCPICGGIPERAFDIDHDHATGEFRGFLCGRCNKGLGLLGDSIEGLEAALHYLRSSPTGKNDT